MTSTAPDSTPLIDRGIAEPAQLTNMRLGLSTMLDCHDAEEGSPRMALFYGPSGYGKSVAAATVAARMNAAYVVAKEVWNKTSLLKAIATEIGITRLKRTNADLFEQIVDQLRADPQPLIIDEMDYLVEKKNVNVIRDIHDNGMVPVLMIGEESLPAKLKAWERFDNRILVATPAQPATLADARLLRSYYCQKVAVADDLLEAILRATGGVTRRVVTNLQKVQSAAIAAGAGEIDLAAWGDRRFATGAIITRKAA